MNEWEEIYKVGSQLNKYPYDEVVSWLFSVRKQHSSNSIMLDVGCGSGVHCKLVEEIGLKAVGFDLSPSAVRYCSENFPNSTFHNKGLSDIIKLLDPNQFELVIDRLSSTHSTYQEITQFYKRLKPSLVHGADLFWQGFSKCSSYFNNAKYNTKGFYNVNHGIFEKLGNVLFFNYDDIKNVFSDYKIKNCKIIKHQDYKTKHNHSYWCLHLEA